MTQHVIPLNDLKEHTEETTCHCNPKIINQGGSMIVVHNAFDKREITEVPKAIDVIMKAKFFIYQPEIGGNFSIACYMNKKENGRWEGYYIRLKYLHEVGYYYDLTPFGTSVGNIEELVNLYSDNMTRDINTAMKFLGNCPKCQSELWNSFNWELHNINTCGNKRAVAQFSEA